MSDRIRVLIVDDSPDDALLMVRALQKDGFEVEHKRVDTEAGLTEALDKGEWDAILTDYQMPGFGGMQAIRIIQNLGLDIPTILLSGAIGEEMAVEAMRSGAHDVVMKNEMSRLGPALRREIRDAGIRWQHKLSVRRVSQLNSMLNAIRAVNHVIVHTKERGELVDRICHGIVDQTSNQAAWIILVDDEGKPKVYAECGIGESFQNYVEELKTGRQDSCFSKAINTAGILLDKDINDCPRCPLGDHWDSNGVMRIRIEHRDRIYGVAAMYLESDRVVLQEEKVLFEEVAGDIGYALASIDIEEQQADAETTIINQRDYAQKLLDTTQAIVLQLDDQGKILGFNRYFETLSGYTLDDVIGRDWIETFIPDSAETEIRSVFKDTISAGQTTGITNPVKCRNGDIRLIDWHNVTFPNYRGKTIVLATGQDVTERRRAEESLRQQELLYRQIFEKNPIGIYRTTPDGRILIVNPAMVKILRFGSLEELMQRNLEENGYQANYERNGFKERLEQDGEIFGLESAWTRQDGSTAYVRENARIVRDQNTGEIQYYEGTAEDITERRQAEEQLEASEQRYRHLFQNMQAGIALHEMVFDDKGQPVDYMFLEVNNAFEMLTGLIGEDVVGHRATEILPGIADDPANWIGTYGEVVTSGKTQHFERYAKSLEKWFSVVAYKTDDNQFATIFYDVTVRKEAEKALHKANQEWNQTFNTITDMITVHDTDFNIIRANQAAIEGLGLSKLSKLYGTKCFKHYHGTDAPPAGCPSCDCFQSREPSSQELFEPHLNAFIEIRAIPTFDESNQMTGLIHVVRDITKRKEIEENYRKLYEEAPVPYITTDKDRMIQHANAAAAAFTEYSIEELTGKPVWELYAVDSEERAKVLLARLNQHESLDNEIMSYRCKDGQLKHGALSVRPQLDEKGMVIAARSVILDVTKEVEFQTALADKERSMSTLLGNLQGMAYRCKLDRSYTMEFVSSGCFNLTGYKPAELIDNSHLAFADMIHPDDVDLVWTQVNLAVEEGRHFELEYRLVCADQQIRWVAEKGMPVEQDDNGTVILEGFISDISEQVAIQQVLADNEERLRLAMSVTNQGTFDVNLKTGKIVISDSYLQLLGYEEGSTQLQEIGYNPESFDKSLERWMSNIHPVDNDRAYQMFKDYLNGDIAEYSDEFRIIVNGQEKWINSSGKIIERDDEGQPVRMIGIHVDIDARKKAELARDQLESHMRQQQKLEAIGTLAGGVAHEINNPVMGIMNYAQIIRDETPTGNEIGEMAEEILHETERVALIVKNLLTFARDEKQRHSQARLVDIVDATMSLITSVLRHDQIELTVEIPEDLPQVKCRSQQIQQVIMNLVTNARDALNEKYPKYDKRKQITISASEYENEDRRWLRTTVEDYGPGISKEAAARIFDPFFTTKPRDVGTGLGLSISHGIVKEHHGKLTVESKVGECTRFHMDLPLDNGLQLDDEEE